MTTEYERDTKAAFIAARIGDRVNEMAEVDLHFVLPLNVFARYQTLIEDVTNGEFKVAAGYNLILLYTNYEDAQRGGTVMFGRDLDGLIAAWSNVLDDIATYQDKSVRHQRFKNAHAHFRGSLWLAGQKNSDPCASANFVPKRAAPLRKPFWKRFLN